ncbi:LuxR family transcriptional regulator [Tersicoccus solisilvae]|uniref:LuxR family transcriptional regulator n=1 Tax=Tersicoccus solisilvae TaxID=1882339 RepID=A0ABQ1PNF0_9MICC|nr:helix-turn-helix transcriptional regulator [Tersicoccus solisilvae]GGD00042.1 LuxR family transcriptional regulator [Tersicoccus solisilvae]
MSDVSPLLRGSRLAIAERIAGQLRSGSGGGSLVLADIGMGKTMVAQGVRDLLDGRLPISTVLATSSLSTVPFGALGPYLSGLSARDVDSPVAVMRQLNARFHPDDAGNVPVLVLDDAQFVDESSAALIAQLVAGGQLRLVALGRRSAELPADLLQLTIDGLIDQIDLDPMAEQEIQQLCETVLAGPVLHSVGGYLARASEGNPMMAQALIEGAVRTHSLVRRRGVWILVGEFPSADLPLTEVIKRELVGRPPAERRALELVSLADPLPLSVAERLGHREAIARLEAARIVTVSQDEAPVVRPSHPLYGDLVRALVPRGRSLLIRQQLVEQMDFDPYSFDGLLHHVAWSLDCGIRVPDQHLLKAARLANQVYNPDFALRAATVVTAPELVGAAQVEIARATFLRGNTARAVEIAQSLATTSVDPVVVSAAVIQMAQIHLQTLGLSTPLRADARLWRSALERIEADRVLDDFERTVMRHASIGTELIETGALLLESRFDGLEERLRTILASPDQNLTCRIVALTQLGEVLAWTGRPRSGVECTQEAFALMTQASTLTGFHEYVLTRHVIACIHVPRWDDVRAMLQGYSDRGPANLIFFGGAVGFVRGMIAVLTGDVDGGLGHLLPAVEALRESDVENCLPLALGVTAFAASLRGDAALVERCREDFEWLPARTDDPKYQMATAFMGLASVRTAGPDAALDAVEEVARASARSGAVTLELDVRLFGAFLGPPRDPQRILDLTAGLEGDGAAMLRRYARALLDGDAEGLAGTADAAVALGYAQIALHARRAAVPLLEADGNQARARELQRLITTAAGALGVDGAAADGGPRLDRLTRREREIVEHLLAGRTNRQIATAVGVSVRTVENHLYRVYPKLGVTRRDELVALRGPATTP